MPAPAPEPGQLGGNLGQLPGTGRPHRARAGLAALMTDRRGRELEQWMTAAATLSEPALTSFVTGLRADQDAVLAGLTLPWSSGSVERHVNRIKMLKRQMYGRANPDQLRRRVMLAD